LVPLVVDCLLDGTLGPGSPLLECPQGGVLRWVAADTDEAYLRFVAEQAASASRVIVHVLTPIRAYRGSAAVHPAGTRLIEALDGTRTILAGYGNPCLAEAFLHPSTVINAYDCGPASQRAVLRRVEG
jgi:beta-glucosidase